MSDQVKGFVRVAVSDERLPFIYNICSWLASLSNTEQRPRNSITGGESHGLGLARALLLPVPLKPPVAPAASHVRRMGPVCCALFHLWCLCVSESKEPPCLSGGSRVAGAGLCSPGLLLLRTQCRLWRRVFFISIQISKGNRL